VQEIKETALVSLHQAFEGKVVAPGDSPQEFNIWIVHEIRPTGAEEIICPFGITTESASIVLNSSGQDDSGDAPGRHVTRRRTS